MFVSEYFGLGDGLDKKEIFDCILDKDNPFFIIRKLTALWYLTSEGETVPAQIFSYSNS